MLPAALGLHQNRSPLARIPHIRSVVRAPSARRFSFLRGGGEELRRALALLLLLRLHRLEPECRTVAPHRMHDHRKLPRDRHVSALVTALLGDLQAPGLEAAEALEARQHDIRRLIERVSDLAVAGLGDVAGNVNRRSRLPPSRRQPEVGADGLRAAELARIVDRSLERQSADRPDARYPYEAPADVVLARDSDDDLVQPKILLPQRRARPRHAIDDAGDQRILRDELAHARFELSSADGAELQAEGLDRVADGVLNVERLALQVTPVRHQEPQPVAVLALEMDLLEPAGAHDMGDPLRVGAIRLVAHGRERGAGMIGLEAHHRQSALLQLRLQPRRKGARLVANASQAFGVGSQRREIASGSVSTLVSSTNFPS